MKDFHLRYIITANILVKSTCLVLTLILLWVSREIMAFAHWPGQPPGGVTALTYAIAFAGFSLFFISFVALLILAWDVGSQIALNLVFYKDTRFREAILKNLKGNPPAAYQMYDGVMCFSDIPTMSVPLFKFRMELMVQRGLIEKKIFSPSVWRSYQNIPGYRIPQITEQEG